MPASQHHIISKLQQDILRWEGYKPPAGGKTGLGGLGRVEEAFPNGVFPAGAVHEVVCATPGEVAAAAGFVTGLLSALMQEGGACLWVGLSQTLFAPALKAFGIEPDRVIFLNLLRDKDVLWVVEEALKCKGLAAVIGEVSELDFKLSRRLQLAVEQSHVTGFVLRNATKKLGATACAARWHIRSLPSQPVAEGLPGLGPPRWQVELLKVRNGRPGSWVMEWDAGKFVTVDKPVEAEEGRQNYA
ncbi:Error-prone repair protein ImuA [Mucilaginibacter hurinus]|uniref:Error-prone repair protein ImuA n=1 Tax=Mucilaginibacter hurinus TaxID=2201324 RepID=A0A367GU78_9SPHI|nr:Error-prone repair protein ImuA [Mucilaginibacter hurinus]RCH56351.1 Error-prone repair protein ImuA [Mucilaginibacter hurinus]